MEKGSVLIFERAPIESAGKRLNFSLAPMLLFANSFRGPQFYEKKLEELGFREISVQKIVLEMPFFISDRKPEMKRISA